MNNIQNVRNVVVRNQQVSEVENKQGNLYRVNFKAEEDRFDRQTRRPGPVYTQPAILNQQDQFTRLIEQQEKEAKKQKRKSNIGWGISIASGLAIIAMAAITLRGGKDAGKVKDLKVLVEKIQNPTIKREASEELARQEYERSLYRVADLIQLDKLATTCEQRTPADISLLKGKLDSKIIGQEKAKQPIIDFCETINYDIVNQISQGKPVIVAIDGPPGTSKTTLLKEAADGLGMYFKKIPLSSIEKPGSLVGFERTYSGAKAGTIATAQLEGNTKKVFYALDELEKAPQEVRNTLLSLLDDQAKFKDLYYNCEIDLTQSIFGITTNELERLKGSPLYDRIKPFVIKVTKYDNQTKAKIAKIKLESALKENKMADKVKVNEEIYDLIAKHTADDGGRETTNIAETRIITELKKLLNYKKADEIVTVDKEFIERLLQG